MNETKGQIELREYWSILMRRKVFLLIPLMIIPLVTFIAGFFTSPVYESTVTLLIDESQVLPPSVERQLEGGNSYMRGSVADRQRSLTSQITSTRFLRRLIAILDIPISPAVRALAAEMKVAYPEISETELAETIIADDLRNKVSINLSSLNLLIIAFEASNPVMAQKRAKTLADIFIEESLAQELAGVRSNISFSQEQLELYKAKLTEAEEKLRDFRRDLIVSNMDQDTSGYNLLQIASAIEAIDLEISSLEGRLLDQRGILIAGGLEVNSIVIPNEFSSEKEKLLSDISTLADLLTRYSWKEPKVLNLNEEAKVLLTDLNERIESSVNKRYADLPAQTRKTISEYLVNMLSLDFNRTKRNTLNESIVKIKTRLSDNPDSEITMKRLQSEIDNYKTLYDLFVQHSQFAAINQSAKKIEAEAKYVVIKPASMPLAPKSPDKRRLFIMGVLLALVIGGGAIVLLEFLDGSFKKTDDVEATLNLPVLGTIPHMKLPYGSSFKKKIPYILGVGISFALVVWIFILSSKGNG